MANTKKLKYEYVCPVRGRFDSREAEERHLIDCVKYLMERKQVPANRFAFKQVLQKLGSGGRNSIRPDILVFDRPVKEAIRNGEINKSAVRIVAEIKNDSRQKKSAIDNQLIPAMKFCESNPRGIYWDSAARLLITVDGGESPIANLPMFNKWNKTAAHNVAGLSPLSDGTALWNHLEQALRNHQGGGGKQLYKEVFKLLVSKLYDEKHNPEDLQFCVREGGDPDLERRIKKLYDEARVHYRLFGEFREIMSDKIDLRTDALRECAKAMSSYHLLESDAAIIQDFYMRFVPLFLQKDLQQYYTPKELVEFMTRHISVTRRTSAIDPCSGSGDFMVGVLRKARSAGLSAVDRSIHCWDIDQTAATLAQVNMISNGDGLSNVAVLNSLDEFDRDAGYYEFVITNPPFGEHTLYVGDRKKDYAVQSCETGKLFIERGLNLLRPGGLLISVLPTGYLVNPSDVQFREVIFNRARVLAAINLPGVFKAAGTGVGVSVIFIHNVSPPDNYKIFAAVAKTVGFNFRKKNTPPLFKQRPRDGVELRDDNNNPLPDNDLLDIAEQLKSFAEDEEVGVLDKPMRRMAYDSVPLSQVKRMGLIINAKLYDRRTGYRAAVKKIRAGAHFTLAECGAEVSNDDNLQIDSGAQYSYFETSTAYKDTVKLPKTLRGWELPSRAKQRAKEGDIFIAKMCDQEANFFFVYPPQAGALVTNGFYKIRIGDRRKMLSLYRFLFSPDYAVQMGALFTGSIMGDIKRSDLLSGLFIPLLDDGAAAIMEGYIAAKAQFAKMGIT